MLPKLKAGVGGTKLSPQNGLKISSKTEPISKLPLRQAKPPSKPVPPASPKPNVSYKGIANNKKQSSESDCKGQTGIPVVSKKTQPQPGRPGFRYGDVDLQTKYKQKPHPRIVIETKQNDSGRHFQGGESNFLPQKEKVATFTKEANKNSMHQKTSQKPNSPILIEIEENEGDLPPQKEKFTSTKDSTANDNPLAEETPIGDKLIQPKVVEQCHHLGGGAEHVLDKKYIVKDDPDAGDKALIGDYSDAHRTLNYDAETETDESDTDGGVIPTNSFRVSLMDLLDEYPSVESKQRGPTKVENTIHTVVIGTEILNQKEQLYIQQNCTSWWDTMKFNRKINYNIYDDLTKPPILSVSHTRHKLGKHFVGYENLQFIVKSVSGSSGPTELESKAQQPQSQALLIKCVDCPATDCALHAAEIFICDGMIKLGSCEFLSCDPTSTSLLLKNIITAEGFIVRFSKDKSMNSNRNFKVFEWHDSENPEIPMDPLDEENDGPIVSLISHLKSSKECLALTFTETLSSLSKGLILSGALLINYDLLKNH